MRKEETILEKFKETMDSLRKTKKFYMEERHNNIFMFILNPFGWLVLPYDLSTGERSLPYYALLAIYTTSTVGLNYICAQLYHTYGNIATTRLPAIDRLLQLSPSIKEAIEGKATLDKINEILLSLNTIRKAVESNKSYFFEICPNHDSFLLSDIKSFQRALLSKKMEKEAPSRIKFPFDSGEKSNQLAFPKSIANTISSFISK